MKLLFYLWAVLIPLQNVVDKLDGPLKSIPGVNITNLAILGLLIYWMASTLAKGRPLLPRSRLNKVLGLYALITYLGLWRAVAYVNAPAPLSPSDPSFVWWKDYMSAILLFFVVQAVIRNERTMRVMTALMLLPLPYMIMVHRNHLQWGSSWHYDHDLRVSGTFMHLGSNELAAFYVVSLLVALGLAIHMSGKWRLGALLALSFLIWGVVNSYSRSTYVAAMAGAAFVGLLKNRRLFLVLIVFVVIAPFVLPVAVLERFGMIDSAQTTKDESTAKRMEVWDVAWRRFQENPILGTGFRSFPKLNKYGMDTHNMYLKVLCELGIMGFLLFIGMLVMALRQSWRLYGIATTPFLKGLSLGLMSASISVMIINIMGDRSSYLAVTGHWWIWHGMAACAVRHIEDGDTWTADGIEPAPARVL